MVSKLSNEKSIINTYIGAESYQELELNSKCCIRVSFYDIKKAKEYYQEIKRIHKGTSKQFQQVMGRRQLMFDEKEGKVSNTETIQKCEELLRLTQPYYKEENIRAMEVNRCEVELLNIIANSYERLGEKEKADYIRKEVLIHFSQSKVLLRHRATEVLLILENTVGTEGSEQKNYESVTLCREGIRLCLECGVSHGIQMFLAEMAYSLELMNLEKQNPKIEEEVLEYFRQTLIMSDLIQDNFTYNFIKKHVESLKR